MQNQYKTDFFHLTKILDENTFTFPNFQRGISWSDKKKKGFIKTLINGEPFGSILIYNDNKQNTILIDGLQRITTIREFNKDRYKLLSNDIIDDSYVNLVINNIKKIYKNNKTATIDTKVRSRLNFEKTQEIILSKIIKNKAVVSDVVADLRKYYKINFATHNEVKSLSILINTIIKDINRKTNISKLRVPVIIYTGNEENLPNIFYNLNTGGVAPSKYEVLASLWADIKYVVDDYDIIDAVYSRYLDLKKSAKLKVTVQRKNLETEGITLFEYCYAIGRILYSDKNNYKYFLGSGNGNIESLSFSLIALLLHFKENEASKIGEILKDATGDYLVDLKNVIIEGFDFLYQGLEYWVKSFRVTKDNATNGNVLDSKYMICHMFMSYIKHNYEDTDFKNLKVTRKRNGAVDNWNKDCLTYIHQHYFYDYLTDYWYNNRQVSNLTRDIQDANKTDKYSKSINAKEWKAALNDFKDEQLSYSGNQFSKKTKLFLDYLVKFKTIDHPELKDKYLTIDDLDSSDTIDIEHIVPKSRIEERTLEKELPVYSLGNACYLNSRFNKMKHEKTIYEFFKSIGRSDVDHSEFNEYINYPNESELKFIGESKREEFKQCYNEFIKKRLDILIEEFIENVK